MTSVTEVRTWSVLKVWYRRMIDSRRDLKARKNRFVGNQVGSTSLSYVR
jgi:hypothetical protein